MVVKSFEGGGGEASYNTADLKGTNLVSLEIRHSLPFSVFRFITTEEHSFLQVN